MLRYGLERLAADAAAAGIDGCLLTDVSVEEAASVCRRDAPAGLDTVFLAAPTSTARRLKLVAQYSTGFVYLVSRTGVTGERESLSSAVGAADSGDARGDRSAAGGRVRHLDAGACGRVGPAGGGGGGGQRDRAPDRAERGQSRRSRFSSRSFVARAEARIWSARHDGRTKRRARSSTNCRARSTTSTAASWRCSTSARAWSRRSGASSSSAQLPIYEPKREDEVFANVIGRNQGPLTPEAVRRIFERIIDEMRSCRRERMEAGWRQVDASRDAGGRDRSSRSRP